MSTELSLVHYLKATSLSVDLVGQLDRDLNEIENLLNQGVRAERNLPQDLALYLIRTGGKRLRPLLLCLSYRGHLKNISDQFSKNSTECVISLHTLATVAEWVHTATLFHDDVIDASAERRSQPSAHILHGNKNAILVGDFVYAEAFAKLMDLGLLAPSQRLAHTVKQLVEGELLQHHVARSRTLLLSDYQNIALCKTGALFAWCTQSGAWLATQQQDTATWDLGARLGTAFQMADDFIDTFEFNPMDCSVPDLEAWQDCAPPLPIVIANELGVSRETTQLWSSLSSAELSEKDLRSKLSKLIQICHHPKVKIECFEIFNKEFNQAVKISESLNLSPFFSWALDIIYERAKSGLNYLPVSFNTPSKEANP
jgi:octaprenyl-diphosphate synthase